MTVLWRRVSIPAMRFPTLTLAVASAAALACGCSNAPRESSRTEDAAAAPAAGQPSTTVPSATLPTTPPHLMPRADGTYVDMNGNILTPPPVMLGVTMEQPGPSLVTHLGVNPARTSLLVDVIPGLPADRAGLKDHDLVIAVDGSQDASPHNIRTRLRKMKPGETITFTVRRGNESSTVTLAADAWKAEHMVRPLHAGTFNRPGLGQDADSDPSPRELAPVIDRLERIERQLQELSRQANTSQPGKAAGTAPSRAGAAAKPAPQPSATKPASTPEAPR